jgi:hypothetical protein
MVILTKKGVLFGVKNKPNSATKTAMAPNCANLFLNTFEFFVHKK